MILNFRGTQIRFRLIAEDAIVSRHSGKSLRKLRVEMSVRGEDSNDHFLSLMRDAGETNITSTNEINNSTSYWKVANHSYSYSDRSVLYHHSLEIEEVEMLNVSSLEIDELTLEPYFYQESFLDEELAIELRTNLNKEQHTLLKQIFKERDEVTVIRRGISDTPVQMIVLIGYWSTEDDNNIKHELRLTQKTDSQKRNPFSALRWLRPMSDQVAEDQAAIGALIRVLERKNILTTEEAEEIRTEATTRSWENRYNFFKVDDLEEDLPA